MLTRAKLGYAPGMMDAVYLRQDIDTVEQALHSPNAIVPDILAMAAEIEGEARRLRIPELLTKTLIQRAQILMRSQQHRAAIVALQEADQALGDLRPYDLKVSIFAGLAEAQAHLGDWQAVAAICGQGIKLVETYRYQVSGQYLQSAYLRSRIGLYAHGVRAAYETQEVRLMLEWAELSKCRSVLRQHQGASIAADRQAQTELDFRRVCQEIDAIRQQKQREAPEALLIKRRTLWDLLVIQRAQARSKAPLPEFTLEAVQATLDADEAILYYYWLDAQTLLIAVIDQQQFIPELRSITAQERSTLEKFARFVLGFSPARNSPKYLDKVQNFAALLLPQLGMSCLHGKCRLLISPHRLLHALPFHALHWPDEDKYLIQHFAVTYTPNLTNLLLRHPTATQQRVLALGISDYEVLDAEGRPLPSLKEAEQEVDELERLYAEQAIAITAWRGANATENRLHHAAQTDELASFSCLHFATHGFNLDSDTPIESYLFLRNSILEGLEIANWRLSSPLVVLSACCSGQRAIEGRRLKKTASENRDLEELPGDDLFGLQAAFFAAGARQVLGALWPVDSAAACQIMIALHNNLATGNPPEIALQAALLDYLNTTHAQPLKILYYWAPFFLSAIGRPERRM